METQFVLRTDKKDAAGRCPVHLVVYFDGLRLKSATGEKCKVAEWNGERQRFRSSFPLAEEANNLLARRALLVLEWWRGVRAAGVAPTLAGLRAALARPTAAPVAMVEAPVSVAALLEQHIEVLRGRGFARHTLRQRRTLIAWLVGFEQHRGGVVVPAGYDLATHDELLHYLRFERKLADNTIATAVRGIKVFLKWCRDDCGLAVPIDLRKMSGKHTDALKLWLTASDLAALQMAMLPGHLDRVRDVFLFCCYTGLRYSDVRALQPGNVQAYGAGRVLRLVQSKTRTGVSIYLTEAAGAIIDKYAAEGERARVLPVLANAVMNRYLKRVAKLAGLTGGEVVVTVVQGEVVKQSVPKFELVTMHTARHTFATQSLLRGMPAEVLQKVMGHTSLKTTMLYAKVVEDLQHETMRRVWEPAAAAESGTAAGKQADQVCAVELAA